MKIKTIDFTRLKDIGEFGGTTVELAHRRYFAGSSLSAAESWLRRGCKYGWLRAAPLDGKRSYYHLTVRAVRWLRKVKRVPLSRAAARALRPMTKAQRFAALLYCTPESGPLRHAYRPSHDAAKFPDIAAHIASGKADPLRQKLFYKDGEMIGLLLLDRGQDQFIERKAKPKVLSLAGWDSFLALIQAGRFRLTVVTVTESRQRQLLDELSEDAPEFPHEIVILPDLGRVLPQRRARAQPGALRESAVSMPQSLERKE
jgi:hypothetical protein